MGHNLKGMTMNWLDSLKVSNKLVLSYGVLVVLILLSGLVTVTNISRAEGEVENMAYTFSMLQDVGDLREAAFEQSTAVRGLLLTGDRANLDLYETAGAAFDKTHAALLASVTSDVRRASLEKLKNIVETWRADVAARQIQLMRQPMTADEAKVMEAIGGSDAFQNEFNKVFVEILKAEEAAVGAAREDAFSAFSTTTFVAILGGALSLAIAVGAGWLLTQSLSKPIMALTDVMRRLTQQDYAVDVPARGRHDEIGEMADAVDIFKGSLIENQKLQEAAAERQQAEVDRARRLEGLIHGFEGEITELTTILSSASTELQSTANSLAGMAKDSSTRVSEVVETSMETTNNVGAVATASTQLSGSISEISRQVTMSSNLAKETKDDANSTNASVQDLAEAAGRIGEVVTLIRDIAAQTNLLALNATIESARAGEAGKGFAVVAQEVKALAEQTTSATEEIAAQIQQVQDRTSMAVDAIEKITGRIGEIESVVTQVAAAVEEQEAATREISRNAEQVSSATARVSENMHGVKEAAEQTGSASADVLTTAEDLSRQAENMKSRVHDFLSGIKAS
ncbi:methyl-accepting chemotaxis protein [Tepidicaulis marinus]|uniref:Methyl-accepting chemotaxis protein n=2 Tax=Tepidicaulis marinus TaxID=1333998 RepID=A0A081BCH8_9HYPH|nr:methyl-accepting chemotaxis protein [Tepidicaulis marinus]